MDERQRRLLQRNRLRLVTELRVGELWEPLRARGLFTADMIEEMRRAGTRRDQARQLTIDLQTRGSQAFPIFVACLEETGHTDLACLLREECLKPTLDPVPIRPVGIPSPKRDTVHENEFSQHRTPEQVEMPQRASEKRGSADIIQGDPRNNRAKAYILEADPCGFCLIINNVTFLEHTNLSARVGSDIDRDKLHKLFQSFHFEVQLRENLKGKEIHSELQSLAATDHSRLDCCVVVILSHGCEVRHNRLPGGIYGVDGVAVPVERVVTYFDGHHCLTLRGKPKLFFIQACAGDGQDKGFTMESTASDVVDQGLSVQSDATPFSIPPGGHDQPDAVSSLPTPSDILVSYSTYPGFVSWRDQKAGTWYVETLDKVFAENAASEDLQNLLVMIMRKLSLLRLFKLEAVRFRRLHRIVAQCQKVLRLRVPPYVTESSSSKADTTETGITYNPEESLETSNDGSETTQDTADTLSGTINIDQEDSRISDEETTVIIESPETEKEQSTYVLENFGTFHGITDGQSEAGTSTDSSISAAYARCWEILWREWFSFLPQRLQFPAPRVLCRPSHLRWIKPCCTRSCDTCLEDTKVVQYPQ